MLQVTSQPELLGAAIEQLKMMLACPEHSRSRTKWAFRHELSETWLASIEADGQEAWDALQQPAALKSLGALHRVYIGKFQSQL